MNMIAKLKSIFGESSESSSSGGEVKILSPSTGQVSSMRAAELISRNKYWVYAASSKNATTVSSVILRLYSVTDSVAGQKIPQVPHRQVSNKELKKLSSQSNLKANPLVDSTISIQQIFRHPVLELLREKNSQQLLYLIQIFMELTGNAYLYVINDSFGIPADIQLIPTQIMKPKVIDGVLEYQVRTGNGGFVTLTRENVIHFKFPNPANPAIGLAPLQSVVASEDLYESMIAFEFALNNNSAIPSMIIKYVTGELKRDDKKKLESEWNMALRGIKKSGKIKVTDQNFDVEKIGLDPKEMQYLKGKKWVREEVAAAFGVPLSLLTTDNVNMANAEAGIRIYREFTIIPRLQLLESTLTSELLKRYASGDRLFFAFDSIMAEDKAFKLKEITELFKAEIIDKQEARDIYGLETQ